MSDDLEGFLHILRNGDGYDQRAADEITSLRARLEQAERERAHWRLAALMSRREGFRAGIESATEACRRMRDLHAPTQEAIYAQIRALAEQKEDE